MITERDALAAVLDIVGRIAASGDVKSGCHILANEIRGYLGSERVVVGLVRPGSGHCRLECVSGMAEIDPRSDLARTIEATLNESILRNALTTWPCRQSAERPLTTAA